MVGTLAAGFVAGKAASWRAGKLKNLANKALPKLKTTVKEGAGKFIDKLHTFFGENGVTFGGRIYRNVNNAYNPLDMGKYTINANHRYTQPVIPGLYFSSRGKIVKAELGNYNVLDFSNRTTYMFDVKSTNMLDVTNPKTRKNQG